MDKRFYIKQINLAISTTNRLYKEYAKRKGINLNTLDVLYSLHDFPECSLNMIADFWGLPKQTVHGILADLLKQGYITKEVALDDKRKNIVCLTPTGKEYVQQILQDLHQIELNTLERIGHEKNLQMIKMMESYNEYFKEELDNTY